MNIFTAHRDHARLGNDLFYGYTDERAEEYLESTRNLNRIRVPLRKVAAPLVGVLVVIVVVYNIIRITNGDNVSLVEMAFPVLAMLFAWTLQRVNRNPDVAYWREANKKVEDAKKVRELLDSSDII